MLFDLGLLIVGVVVLVLGAEWLVRGASSLAVSVGLRPLIVGLTVVALGTSLPEFVTNVFAAMRRADDLALGNILGSNIANVGLILGTGALMMPLAISPQSLRREYPIMLGVQILFFLLALDGTITRFDGTLLLICLGLFLLYLIRDARRSVSPDMMEDAPAGLDLTPLRRISLIVFGTAALAAGAHLMVTGAVNIAEAFGISAVIIGLTIVAIGTSLPELAATIVGIVRGAGDLAFGNVIGSNLLNVLFVVGLVSAISPLRVADEVLQIHFPVMIGFCLLLLLAWSGQRLSRWHGVILVAGFVGYSLYLVLPLL